MSPPAQATAEIADPFGKAPAATTSPAPASGSSGYDAALAEARKIYAKPGETFSLAAANAPLLGAVPDIDAWIAGVETSATNLADAVQGKHPKYTAAEASRAVKQSSREALDKFGKDHPVGAFATDFIGGLATPGLGELNDAMKLKKIPAIWRAAGVGGVLGGGRGFFDSEGKPAGERAKQTAESAGFGATGGAVLHQAGHMASKVLGRVAPSVGGMLGTVKNRLSSTRETDPDVLLKRQEHGQEIGKRMVSRRVTESDPTGAKLTRNPAEHSGKDITAAEALGRHDVGRLGSASKREGPNADSLVARVQARGEQTGQRIADHVAKVAHLDSDAIEGDFEATNKQLRARAAPLYEAWHAHENVESPELKQVRETPAFRKAMAKAAEIIANEHGDATEEGLQEDDVPFMRLDPTTKQPVEIRSGGRPVMLPKTEAFKIAAEQGFTHPMEGGDEPIPTAKGYDYVKRGFDALINAHKDPTTGRIDFSNADVKALVGLRSELNAALTDEAQPWGKDAKAAYAAGGDAPMQEEAFRSAEKVMSPAVSDHDFEKAISRYTPAQMDALRAGVANQFRDLSRGKGVRIGTFLNPNAELKIRRIFGQHAGDSIIRDLRTEAEMGRTGKQLTPKATVAGEKFDEDIQRHAAEWYHGAMAGESLGNLNLVRAALHGFRALSLHGAKWLETPEGKSANDEIVRLLGMKPSELASELEKEGASPAQVKKTNALFETVRKSGLADNLSGKAGGIIGAGTVDFYGKTFGGKKDDKAAPKAEDDVPDPFGKPIPSDAAKETKADYSEPPPPHAPNEQVSGYLENTLGVPVTITSGYRDAEHNAEVGGVPGSAHTKGEAWDFQPHGMSMEDAGFRLAHSGIPFDQIEITPDHVHVSFAPQMRGMVIQHGFGRSQSGPDPAVIAALSQPDPSAMLDQTEAPQ